MIHTSAIIFGMTLGVCVLILSLYRKLNNKIDSIPTFRIPGGLLSGDTKYYRAISDEIRAVKTMLEKHYLNKHIDIEYSIGDCIRSEGEYWKVKSISVEKNYDEVPWICITGERIEIESEDE